MIFGGGGGSGDGTGCWYDHHHFVLNVVAVVAGVVVVEMVQ